MSLVGNRRMLSQVVKCIVMVGFRWNWIVDINIFIVRNMIVDFFDVLYY